MAFVTSTLVRPPLRPTWVLRDNRRPVTMSSSQTPKNKVLADVTKFTVSAAVAGLVLYKHDAPTILYVLASLANSASAKVLKFLIKQPRPDGAQKGDPGMPSSHATSLSFLSLAFLGYIDLYAHSALKTAGAGIIVLLSVMASYWRVSAGYHTVPQVLVGWLVGSFNAAVYTVTLAWTIPRLELLMRGKALLVTFVMLLVSCSLGCRVPEFFQREENNAF